MTDRQTDGIAMAYTRYSIYATVAHKNATAQVDISYAKSTTATSGKVILEQRLT